MTACDFHDSQAPQLRVGPDVEAALIVANRFRGAERVDNQAGRRTEVGLNLATTGPEPRSGDRSMLDLGCLPRWRA